MTDKELKEIERLRKQAQDYFGKDETIYIYQCTKCKKFDPVPGFIVNEQLGFLKYIGKKKTSPEMECPYCGKKSLPIDF